MVYVRDNYSVICSMKEWLEQARQWSKEKNEAWLEEQIRLGHRQATGNKE